MPFDPTDYGSGTSVEVWYDHSVNTYNLDAGGDAASDNETVQTLVDRSSNANNAVQTNSALRGRWQSNEKNGLGILELNDSSRYALADKTIFDSIGATTIAVVFKYQDVAARQSLFESLHSNYADRIRPGTDTTDHWEMFGGRLNDSSDDFTKTSTDTLTDAAWYVACYRYDFSNDESGMHANTSEPIVFGTNGQTAGTLTAGGEPDGLACYANSKFGGNIFRGFMAEYVIWSEKLNDTDVDTMMYDLGVKWDITAGVAPATGGTPLLGLMGVGT